MSTPEQDFFERLKGEPLKETAPSQGSPAEKVIAEGNPDFSTPLTIRNVFIHHDTHPVVMDFALLKTFGIEWLSWEEATLWTEIQRDFNSQISDLSRAKVRVLRAVHNSLLPWNDWPVFEKVVQGLNNNVPRWDVMQAPSLEQLYVGVDILTQLRKEDFGDEVKRYMAASVLNDDVFYVPPPLDFIQVEVSHPYYHCNDCGSEDLALFHDGLCDTCTGRFDPEQGLSMQPMEEKLKAGKGRNLTLMLKYDPDQVQRRWLQVRHKPSNEIELEETPEDVQVAKLLMARDYMNVRRRQLADQLTSLKSWLGAT